MRRNSFILLLILISIPSLTCAEQPIDVLQQSINKGIAILKDPQYRDITQKEKQQQKLCEAARQSFDFREFSKRVLAYNWNDFSSQEREQFVDVFSRFLCKYYLTKLQEKYNDEKVIYLSQQLTAEYRALVKVNVLWKDLEVPVDIRMLKRDGTWKVYDVIVLGVSAVKNYRAQFQEILRANSPAQVIGRIESRIEQR